MGRRKNKKAFLTQKVNGGVLLFSLVISFLILLVVSSIISINYYYSIRAEYSVQLSKLHSNIESAITLALNSEANERTERSDLVDLFGNGKDTVHLQTWSFGLLKGFNLSGSYKQVTMKRRALTAEEFGKKAILFIADHGREISLAGNTEFYGDIYLPKSGYSASSLAGSFLTGNPIKGTKHNSVASLPEFNKELETIIENQFLDKVTSDSSMSAESFSASDSVRNSFSNKTLVIHLNGNYRIRNKYIEGNVVIRCSGNVQIDNSTTIKDAVIIARRINLENESEFSGQLLASDTIATGEKCLFNYPTIIALKQEKNKAGFISLGKENQLTGTVIGLRDKETINVPFGLYVGENSRINGQVYFQGPAALSGEMNGEFYVDFVLSNTTSSVNNNFLYNVSVNKNKLNENLCFLSLTEKEQKKSNRTILKWIY